jgi:hypothetical protein
MKMSERLFFMPEVQMAVSSIERVTINEAREACGGLPAAMPCLVINREHFLAGERAILACRALLECGYYTDKQHDMVLSLIKTYISAANQP